MLMLTHTYLLQKVLGAAGIKSKDPDIYIYNIAPDLLTIHPDINSAKTHNIKRFTHIPEKYPQAAYVMFHLLVDDLAHHGLLCNDYKEEFNPDSQGYCYIKGKPLINNILDLHKTIQNEISYNEAAYRSHLIIEMIYDLVILNEIDTFETISLLAEAVKFTLSNKFDEFTSTISWLYGISEDDIRTVLKNASLYLTEERMERIMNIEGRIRLYSDKFGLKNKDKLFNKGINNLFMLAKNSLELDEKELFLIQTAKTIKDYGWLPPIT
jgi:hypothetical protein